MRNRLTLAILLGSPALVVGDVRRALPARRVRLRAPDPELDGDDRLLDRLRRLLLRAHLRLAPDLHRAADPAPRAPRRPAARRVRRVEGHGPRAVPRARRRGDARACCACSIASPRRPLSTYASIGVGLLLCAVAALGLGLLTSAAVGNVAQATLALPMLCFPAVLFSGAILPVHLMAGAGAALSAADPVALGLRGDRPRPRGTADPRRRRLATRPAAARVVRRRGHARPPARTGWSWPPSPSCSWSRRGACSCAARGRRRPEPAPPTPKKRIRCSSPA